jgi:hypothetical protein
MPNRLMAWAFFAAVSPLISAQSISITAIHPRLILDSPTLTALRARAAANSPEWTRLKSYCDSLLPGTVEFPDGEPYPDGGVGQGYEGDGLWAPIWSEALCYQITKLSDPTDAAKYGAKAVDIAMKNSVAFPNLHSEDPCTDDAYVIRFFGTGLALLYDWTYELLNASQRTQIYSAANIYIGAWESTNSVCGPGGLGGRDPSFAYVHPLGNYFAGYFHAKTAIALATNGENPNSQAEWNTWQTDTYLTAATNPPHVGVQPYFAAHMQGGGWPEGFGNYGPLATLNMSLPVWEVKTATGVDLTTASNPFTYPLDVPDYLMYFVWPSLTYFDDRDSNQATGDPDRVPGTTDVGLYMQALGVQRYFNGRHANEFQQFVNDTIAANGNNSDPWEDFLFYDSAGTTAPYSSLPLSYFAPGLNAVAARSDWTKNAVWMSYRGGPYIENPGAQHEYFDQGSPSLVRGNTPLLLNATGWIVHEPGGNADESELLNDDLGSNGNNTLFNIFYVRKSNGSGGFDDYGQTSVEPGDAHTVTGYEEGGGYTYLLTTDLDDMYRLDSSSHAQVAAWAREIIYLRPQRFVIYDRTTAGNVTGSNTASDQYLAFHFPALPALVSTPGAQPRYDVTYKSTFAGSISSVLPAGATLQSNQMWPDSETPKVWQMQIRPPISTGTLTAASQRWINVFDLSPSAADVATATNLTVSSGNAVGTLLTSTSAAQAILFNTGAANTMIVGNVVYAVPKMNVSHYITELTPNAGYTITVAAAATTFTITVSSGGPFVASAKGVLSFGTTPTGKVQSLDEIFVDGFDS